jgi:photosystem II stability/assembly factor-like uncharacterized protein
MRVQSVLRSPKRRAFAAVPLALGLAAVPISTAPVSAGTSGGDPVFSWELLDSGSEAIFSTLDAVSSDVAWVGSLDGQVLTTADGGVTFTNVTPPHDPTGQQVLDIEASSADEALVLAYVFADETSVMYRTTDAGTNWTEASVAPVGCIAMFDRRHGFAMGDPVDGKFQIIVTGDRGRSWDLVPSTGMPDALEGELSIGFGGECAAATGRKAFFGTAAYLPQPDGRLSPLRGIAPAGERAGAANGRVFRSTDFGLTWEVAPTTVRCCIWGLDFRTNRLGLAIGGDWNDPVLSDRLSRTTDGGVTWQAVNAPELEIPHVSLAWWSDRRGDEAGSIPAAQRIVFATGETSLVSRDRGRTWESFDDSPMYTIDCVEDGLSCWGAGPDGRIAKLVVD